MPVGPMYGTVFSESPNHASVVVRMYSRRSGVSSQIDPDMGARPSAGS